jgi:hypothetical protein
VAVRELTYNPFLPEMLADPYPTYRRLREEDPVHYSDVVRAWAFTRHADVVTAIADPRFSSDRSRARKYKGGRGTSPGTFLTDPPQHTRIRTLATKALTPKVIEAMRSRIEAIVEELLDTMARNNEADVIDEFAYVLPMTVISELIGAPSSDHDRFQRWGREFAGAQDHLYSGRSPNTAGPEMVKYFVDLLPKRPDGLVSALLDVTDGDDKLSDAEVIEVLVGLLFAGHETTVNLIGNGLPPCCATRSSSRVCATRAWSGTASRSSCATRVPRRSSRARSRRTWSGTATSSAKATRSSCCSARPIATPHSSTTRRHSTSRAHQISTWPSDTGPTSASARSCRVSRGALPSPRSSGASRTCVWTVTRRTGVRPSCCAD